MAAIDKLYLTFPEYLELKKLLENQPITDFMKSKGHNYPLINELWTDYWPDWEKNPDKEHPIMQPSPVMWVWLVQNCKIKSVLEQFDYKTDSKKILDGTHIWLNYKRKPCKKVKVFYKGYCKPTHIHNKNKYFWLECLTPGILFYSSDHIWRDYDEGWSGGSGFCSSCTIKFKSVKAIIKHLLKASEASLTFKITSRYINDQIIVKTY